MKFYQKALVNGLVLLSSLGILGCEAPKEGLKPVSFVVSGRVIEDKLSDDNYYFALLTRHGKKLFRYNDSRDLDSYAVSKGLNVLINSGDSVVVQASVWIPMNKELDSLGIERILEQNTTFYFDKEDIKVY